MITVFDRQQIARQRSRAAKHLKDHDFLLSWSMKQIEDRLSIVKRQFTTALQIGCRAPKIDKDSFGIETLYTMDVSDSLSPNIIGHEDFLPILPSSLNLVVSALDLHTVNDLPGALIQIRKALRPDGLFLSAILGGETLYEFRQCLAEAEIEVLGGMSPRIAPFADKPQMGDLLQRAGFSLPVIDSEFVTVTYDSIFPLMKDLRGMGEGNAILERRKTFTPSSLFMRAGELYAQRFSESDGRIRATFEIIFLLGWAPHESQQKPLKPGSAKTRLADFLETEEIGTGEKPL